MEGFFVLVAVALLGAALVTPVVVVLLWVRLSRMEKRLRVLEYEGLRRPEESTPVPRAAAPPVRHRAEESAHAARRPPAPSVAPIPPEPVQPVGSSPPAVPPADIPLAPPTTTPSAPPVDGGKAADPVPAPTSPSPPSDIPLAPVVEAPDIPLAPSAAAPSAAARKKRSPVDWEQWIGIRGAAVLGGLVLALAGLFFVKHSIDAGWISPSVRVALALLSGAVCLGLSTALARRYRTTSNALGGTGLVLLYAGCWAGHVLYDLVNAGVAFGAMTLVTLLGGWLAWRRRSQVMAVLGLLGGFATPAFLSSLEDQPVQVFGYLLLLDVGLLFLGARRRWPVLGGLAMAGTLLYQVIWLLRGGSDERFFLSLAVIGLFGLLFAASTVVAGERRDRLAGGWRSGVVALLGAFALAGMLAFQGDALATHLLAYSGLLALLGLVAQSLSVMNRSSVLGLGAAAASVVSLGAVLALHIDLLGAGTRALSFSLVAVAFALPVLVLRRWKPQWPLGQGALAAALVGGGLAGFSLLAAWAQPASSYITWLVVALVAAVLHIALALVSGRTFLVTLAGLGLGFGLATTRGLDVSAPLPVAAGAGLLGLLANFLPLPEKWQKPVQRGALFVLALPFLGLAMVWGSPFTLAETGWAILGWTLLLAIGAARWRSGWVYALTVALAAFVTLSATLRGVYELDYAASPFTIVGGLLLFVALLVGWPFVWRRRFAETPFAWYGAVAALPLFALSLSIWLHRQEFENRWGVLAFCLALIAGGAFFFARRLGTDAPAQRDRASIGFGAVGLCFAGAAIALFLGVQWITVALALQGVALVGLWRRFDHPVLKYLSLALSAAATLRLVAGPWTLRDLAGPDQLLFNGISYTYLVPAVALVLGLYWMQPLEAARARATERFLYRSGRAWGAKALGGAALGVVFTWINLIIVNAFRSGPELVWAAGRNATRDLTQSLAWTVFAVTLLVLGIALRSKGLRWASLIFLILTIGKVFLFDLGELQDLYRVASLVGLAVALILVSLVYQRFVFKDSGEDDPREGAASGTPNSPAGGGEI
ncbi:MAG: DUF2339 domain-containing protein [Acidobacteriota bacterium]